MTITRTQWTWMLGLCSPFILIGILLGTGVLTVSRVRYVSSKCTSCNMVTELLYYRLAIGRRGIEIPYGMNVYGGTSYCPHTLVYP